MKEELSLAIDETPETAAIGIHLRNARILAHEVRLPKAKKFRRFFNPLADDGNGRLADCQRMDSALCDLTARVTGSKPYAALGKVRAPTKGFPLRFAVR
jgi:hypothetical protein